MISKLELVLIIGVIYSLVVSTLCVSLYLNIDMTPTIIENTKIVKQIDNKTIVIEGEDGERGKSGSDGDDGNDGVAGIAGEDGIDGTIGPIGLTGPKGEDGEDGSISSLTNSQYDCLTKEVVVFSPAGQMAITIWDEYSSC